MDLRLNLETAIFLGGITHLGILSAGAVMTKVLNWKTELNQLNDLTRHIIWTHGSYVWLTILALGLVSVCYPYHLTSNNPLGLAICGFIALFWGIRLFIQFFCFDAKPHLTSIWLKLGFHGLTIAFAYFTIVYGTVAYNGWLNSCLNPLFKNGVP